MTTKQLRTATVGDKIVQFGNVTLDGPAEVVAVKTYNGASFLVEVRTFAGVHTAYPCAGREGCREIVVA